MTPALLTAEVVAAAPGSEGSRATPAHSAAEDVAAASRDVRPAATPAVLPVSSAVGEVPLCGCGRPLRRWTFEKATVSCAICEWEIEPPEACWFCNACGGTMCHICRERMVVLLQSAAKEVQARVSEPAPHEPACDECGSRVLASRAVCHCGAGPRGHCALCRAEDARRLRRRSAGTSPGPV